MVTRLYFHAATNAASGLPTTEQNTLLTADATADSLTTNRSMDINVGTSQASLALNSDNVSVRQQIYFTRFVLSTPLNQTSIAANTWTYNFAAKQSSANANFPANGTNDDVNLNLYVWRPSTGAKIGTILEGISAATVDEAAANVEAAHVTTFTGASVSSMQNGDVLIFEVWFQPTQTDASSYLDTFYFDGTTVNTTDNATVSNHASFIETPENLTFIATSIDMTNVSTTGYTNKFIIKV